MPETKCQESSPSRQTAGCGWRVLAREHARGVRLPLHAHQAGQLVFAVSGVMRVETPSSHWTIPPQRALWVAARHPHAIDMLSDTALRTVYIEPRLIGRCRMFTARDTVHAVSASPLIRALVMGLFEPGRDAGMQRLTVRLLLCALSEAACLPTELPMPAHPGMRAAVSAMMAAQRWDLPLSGLAAEAAMSERSFTRHFAAEAGMSFRDWRQRARLIASLDLLASSRPIKSIASTLGFSSAAAYIAAFRRLMGTPPAEFRRQA